VLEEGGPFLPSLPGSATWMLRSKGGGKEISPCECAKLH